MLARLICVCGLLAVVGGCGEDVKEYKTYGLEVITLGPQWDRDVQSALIEAHDALGNWVHEDDGAKSDSSYKAGGKKWSTEDDDNRCARSYMEFDSEDGAANRIETLTLPELIVITCESSDQDSTIRLRNEVVKLLNNRGFVCRN